MNTWKFYFDYFFNKENNLLNWFRFVFQSKEKLAFEIDNIMNSIIKTTSQLNSAEILAYEWLLKKYLKKISEKYGLSLKESALLDNFFSIIKLNQVSKISNFSSFYYKETVKK